MGLSIWHLLVVLLIALVIFGTRKLRDIGSDLGGAIRNFKEAVKEEEAESEAKGAETQKTEAALESQPAERVIEGKVTSRARPRKKTKKTT